MSHANLLTLHPHFELDSGSQQKDEHSKTMDIHNAHGYPSPHPSF